MAPLLGAVPRAKLASFHHPAWAGPGPNILPVSHEGQTVCRAAVEMLHCHCSARMWGLWTWWWRNHLAAELPIASTGFPEHAFCRICPDCSSGRARQPLSRPGLLSHQIIICQHSSLCNLGAWSEHRGAAYSRDFAVPSETGCMAAGREVTAAHAPPAPARHTQSLYCSQEPSSCQHPLQREL